MKLLTNLVFKNSEVEKLKLKNLDSDPDEIKPGQLWFNDNDNVVKYGYKGSDGNLKSATLSTRNDIITLAGVVKTNKDNIKTNKDNIDALNTNKVSKSGDTIDGTLNVKDLVSTNEINFDVEGENTDPLSIKRINHDSDKTELRINIGDNNSNDDFLSIGSTPSGNWAELYKFTNNGTLYIHKEAYINGHKILTDIDKAADSDKLDGLDSSYYTRRTSSASAAVGEDGKKHWVTVAKASGGRYRGKVIFTDADSGDHTFIEIDWMRSYQDTNFLVVNNGGHNNRIVGARVLYCTNNDNKNGDTYKDKFLQVQITAESTYDVEIISDTNNSGWNNLQAVTPVVEDTKTDYAVKGSEVHHLDTATIATHQGAVFGGDIRFDGIPTTTNQNRGIFWTAFDKEGTDDYSDIGRIYQTANIQGLSGSVLLIKQDNDSSDGVAISTHSDTGFKHNSHTVWTAGNDGSGSGLDADKLDGLDSSSFVRNDTNNHKNVTFQPSSDGGNIGIKFISHVNSGSDYGEIRYYDDNDDYNFWGNSKENGALVLNVQNDGRNPNSDVLVLKTPAGAIIDAPDLYKKDGSHARPYWYTGRGDADFPDAQTGPILKDRSNSKRYRLFVDNGTLGIEEI